MGTQVGVWHALSDESVNDPVEHDRRMRQACPIAHSDDFGGFAALYRYEDLVNIARDPATFSSARSIGVPAAPAEMAPFLPLQSDPPEHRAFRAIVAPLFRASRLESFEPTLRTMANSLIDEFIDRREVELASEYCVPLPATALCLLMGLPIADWRELHVWSMESQAAQSDGDPGRRVAVTQRIYDYFDAAVERCMTEPGDNVMTAMLNAEIDGKKMTRHEMHGMFHLLIAAGHETTSNALANAFRYLADHPDERQRLRDDPALLAPAVEELLRWGAPVRILGRTTTKDVEIRGETFPEGTLLGLMWASGCRDPELFPDPDVCDFGREPKNHIAFGIGVHKCLGEHLARMEMRIGIAEFLRRVDDFSVVGDTEPALWPVIGYRKLPLSFTVR